MSNTSIMRAIHEEIAAKHRAQFKEFVAKCCTLEENAHACRWQLHMAFGYFCDKNGGPVPPMTKTAFQRLVRALPGVQDKNGRNAQRWFTGIAVHDLCCDLKPAKYYPKGQRPKRDRRWVIRF